MTLRYGSVIRSLRSLRGDPTIASVAPSHADVRYRDGVRGLADFYVPPNATGASVVLVHGGGFVLGSRRMKPMRFLTAHLHAAGIAACVFDYRMIFRGGRLAEAVDDVTAAFELWRARVPSLGLDPRAISIAGLSAGATLSLLAAPRLSPASVISCFGLYEMDHLRGPAALLPRLLFRSGDRAAWTDRSPRFATQPTAPTLLLHGTDDGLIPFAQAERLAAHRESLGLPTRLVIYPGAPHGFFNLPLPVAEAGAAEIIAQVRGTLPA